MTKSSRKAQIETECLNRKLGALKIASGSNNLGTHANHEPPSPNSDYMTVPGSPVHTENFDEDDLDPDLSSADSIRAPVIFTLTLLGHIRLLEVLQDPISAGQVVPLPFPRHLQHRLGNART
ncbi:hypothetical protein RhiLY_03461 [Ceratobasidium sp. AG-Ba]|nr:hypothetical protein RhiLY_03461 [Ceratobasidium sp. AG-Ba]